MRYEYEAGVCNINQYQQKRRYLVAVIGFTVAGALALSAYSFNLPPLTTAAIFTAVFAGFEGLYQGRFSFCTGFASKGIRSEGEQGQTEQVDEQDLSEDREMARRIHYYSLLSSLFFTAVFYAVTYTGLP